MYQAGLDGGENTKISKTQILTTNISQSPWGRTPADSPSAECIDVLREEGRGGSRYQDRKNKDARESMV